MQCKTGQAHSPQLAITLFRLELPPGASAKPAIAAELRHAVAVFVVTVVDAIPVLVHKPVAMPGASTAGFWDAVAFTPPGRPLRAKPVKVH